MLWAGSQALDLTCLPPQRVGRCHPTQVQRVHGVGDEVDQMIGGHPVVQIEGVAQGNRGPSKRAGRLGAEAHAATWVNPPDKKTVRQARQAGRYSAGRTELISKLFGRVG